MLVLGSVQTQKTMFIIFKNIGTAWKKPPTWQGVAEKTLPETNSSHMKLLVSHKEIYHPTHQFSEQHMLVSGRVLGGSW